MKILEQSKMRLAFLAGGAVVALGVGVVGAKAVVEFPSGNDACKNCHILSGSQRLINTTIAEHQSVGTADEEKCAACHPDKLFWHLVGREAQKAFAFYEDFTVDPNPYGVPQESETSFDGSCLQCHRRALTDDPAAPERLTAGLREIGLRPAHSMHYRLAEVRARDAERYHALRQRELLGAKEASELKTLSRVISASCADCHLYSKSDAEGRHFVDRTVNFAARQPLGCTGCHVDVHSFSHPEMTLKAASPSRYVCRRCHHGQVHAGIEIFAANCEEDVSAENIDTCARCHPAIEQRQLGHVPSRRASRLAAVAEE